MVTKIEEIIEHQGLNNKNLVIAVPDYLTQGERMAMLNALNIASKGYNGYSFQLLNETEAIGYDYGFYKRNEDHQGKKVVFVDIGHSKMICSLCEFSKKEARILCQQYDRQLGCKNFDAKILSHYGQHFQKKNPELSQDVLSNGKAVLKLLENI